jgi:hypothetical protein
MQLIRRLCSRVSHFLAFLVSPTRVLISFLLDRPSVDRAKLIRRWNWTFLGMATVACVAIYFAQGKISSVRDVRSPLLLFLVWLIPFSRSNEIFYAFLKDGIDRIRKGKPRIPLDAADRVILAGKSYLETILNFALINYMLFREGFERAFRDIAEAVYYSAITIATVGYGDITPRTLLPQFLAIYEVFIGIVLIVVAFAAYIGGVAEKDDSGNIAGPTTSGSADTPEARNGLFGDAAYSLWQVGALGLITISIVAILLSDGKLYLVKEDLDVRTCMGRHEIKMFEVFEMHWDTYNRDCAVAQALFVISNVRRADGTSDPTAQAAAIATFRLKYPEIDRLLQEISIELLGRSAETGGRKGDRLN